MAGVSPFVFSTPQLISSSFSMLRPWREDDLVQVHLIKNIVKRDDGKSAIVELTVQLNKEGNQVREDSCFVAEVMLQSLFSWQEGMDDQLIDGLLSTNAPALLISYARPIIVQLTAASPAPVYHLPFLDLRSERTAG